MQPTDNVGNMWAERRGEPLLGWSYITDPWPEFAMVCDGNTPGLTFWLGNVLTPPGALKSIGDPLCQITKVLN